MPSIAAEREIVYPDSDGEPIADNTLQFRWIATIKGGMDALFRDDPNVFVAGDLLWYPVEGHPEIVRAPDTLLAFGRPKGYRGSYKQWEEDDVAPQVAFEVRSPKNSDREMETKRQFYERYGVEEYYLYDPEGGTLDGWTRDGDELVSIETMQGWISPRLHVWFGLESNDLVLIGPDGRRFISYEELAAQRDQLEGERTDWQKERDALTDELERLKRQLKDRGIDPDESP